MLSFHLTTPPPQHRGTDGGVISPVINVHLIRSHFGAIRQTAMVRWLEEGVVQFQPPITLRFPEARNEAARLKEEEGKTWCTCDKKNINGAFSLKREKGHQNAQCKALGNI